MPCIFIPLGLLYPNKYLLHGTYSKKYLQNVFFGSIWMWVRVKNHPCLSGNDFRLLLLKSVMSRIPQMFLHPRLWVDLESWEIEKFSWAQKVNPEQSKDAQNHGRYWSYMCICGLGKWSWLDCGIMDRVY